nr:hypothetical protein [Streptomyces sp. DSM 41633]
MNETTNPARQRPAGRAPRLVGTVACEGLAHAKYAAGLGLALALVTALLSWVFVKAEWVGRGWFAAPAVLAVAVLLRLTLLAPSP